MNPKTWLLGALVGASAVVGFGCGGKLTTLHFTVSKAVPTQSIAGSIAPCNIAPLSLLQAPLAMNFDQSTDFPQQKTDLAHITSVKLKSLSLTLTPSSPTTAWAPNFLTDLTITVSASGLQDQVVATIGPDTVSAKAIADGATTLDLVPTGVELAPYVKASGGFSLTSSAQGCPPQQEADFDGAVAFKVTAKPL